MHVRIAYVCTALGSDEMTKQETNIKAYKVCYPTSPIEHDVSIHLKDGSIVEWDIFADSPQGALCLQQLRVALREKYDVQVIWHEGEFYLGDSYGNQIEMTKVPNSSPAKYGFPLYKTELDAFAAAVEHVEVKP